MIAGSSSGAFTFTVKNIGTVQATGNLTISLGGANAADFTKAPVSTGTPCVNGGTPLAAGSSCTIDVTFSPQPSASGNRNANLKVSATPGGGPSAALSGTALNAVLSMTPTSWNFGSSPVGTPVGPKTFTVTNNGAATSGVVTFSTGGGNAADFVAVTGATDGCTSGTTTLIPNDSCTIDVTFNPSAGGNRNANLNVSASPGGNVSAALTGTGTIAKLTISPGNYNFGSWAVAGGPTAPFTFTVTNSGTAASGSIADSLGGANPGDFTIGLDTCSSSLSLAVGDSCTIQVQFDPTSTGDKHATLNVTGGAGEGTPHADLSGKGT